MRDFGVTDQNMFSADYEARTTGSFVEKKRASVTFHYRNADPEYGEFQAKECQALLDTMVDKLPMDVLVGKKNLEVRPAHTHKGEIVKRLTYQHADADFLICAGDDKTDEVCHLYQCIAPPLRLLSNLLQDMFRAVFAIESTAPESDDGRLIVTPPPSLALFPSLAKTLILEGEPSKSDEMHDGQVNLKPRKTNLKLENLFTLGIIPKNTRKTIARWYLDEPTELIDLLEVMSKL